MATAAAAATTDCEEVEVTVKQSDGSEVVLIVQLGDTVVDFQTRLAAQTQVPVPRQRLKLGVKELRRALNNNHSRRQGWVETRPWSSPGRASRSNRGE